MLHFSRLRIVLISLVSLLAILFATPNFIPENKTSRFLSKSFLMGQVNLGLDLKGGSQLLLEVDFALYLKEQLGSLKEDLKEQFWQESIRTLPVTEGGRIIINCSEGEVIKIKKIIRKINSEIEITETIPAEKRKQLQLFFSDLQITKMHKDLLVQSMEIIRRRIDESGTKEVTIQAQGNNRILLQVPGVANPNEIKNLLGKTAKMTFHFIVEEALGNQELTNSLISPGISKISDDQGRFYLVKNEVILSGDLLTDANPTYYEGQPAVAFHFNESGTRKFAQITQENIGKIFVIVLDNKVITAPRINAIIREGAGVISGSFTTEDAKQLALLLRAGALPAPLTVIEERIVGPSLGSDSITYGIIASIAGLILVALFMVVFYSSFGLIADLALLVNIALILDFLSLIGATLTLPGIAGIVLTMGMSVDANVLIFERIKEELRNKKSAFSSIEAGFSQAFRTIFDSNITTLIVALFLYIFGNGPIRGFAVTLSIGIVSSMFSAIMLSRMMIVLWIRGKKSPVLPI